jgi:hypothetical protein
MSLPIPSLTETKMGYSIKIGELMVEVVQDGLNSFLSLDVVDVTLPDAPAYGDARDFRNKTLPSYTQWADCMSMIGLYDLFYNKSHGLIRKHPGCVPLTADHKEVIDSAHEAFMKAYPALKIGFCPEGEDDTNWPDENGVAVSLVWLKFWVDWALSNCKIPVISNS